MRAYFTYGKKTTVSAVCTSFIHDVAPRSNTTPCNKIDKPLVVTGLVTLRNDVNYNVAKI